MNDRNINNPTDKQTDKRTDKPAEKSPYGNPVPKAPEPKKRDESLDSDAA